MGGLWSFLLERFSLIPNSGGHLTRGLGEFVSGRTGKRQQDPCWVERGHEGPWRHAELGAQVREAGCGTAPCFSSPSLSVIVWGSGRLWRLCLGPGSPPGNCSDRPSEGPRSPPPTAMIDILLLAPAYLLPAACRYRLQTPFPCLILILFD